MTKTAIKDLPSIEHQKEDEKFLQDKITDRSRKTIKQLVTVKVLSKGFGRVNEDASRLVPSTTTKCVPENPRRPGTVVEFMDRDEFFSLNSHKYVPDNEKNAYYTNFMMDFKINIKNKKLELDLSIDEDLVCYRLLEYYGGIGKYGRNNRFPTACFNPNTLNPAQHDLLVVNTEQEAQIANDTIDIELKAKSKFQGLTPRDIRDILYVYGILNPEDLTDEFARTRLFQLMERNYDKFIEFADRKDVPTLALVKRAIIAQLIVSGNDGLSMILDGIPTHLGFLEKDVVRFLDEPKNNKYKLAVIEHLNSNAVNEN